ncbi:hypothetical protein ABMA28_008929 [Loxostege sticticalis]|uniref:C2H2-type domain-containing protein n=1 Tax=Loxostege sticticalis TaxID=481309 RepID=A0ABD0SHD8_LOXSC
MDTEYDRKFDEMKKYIPFLESMIKRLESTSSAAANPRQAQLDKIKSLRDLLQDKKKRMKMENLLKCEQVLVNLYAKVEQRDALPEKPASNPAYSKNTKQKEDKDLESVRNKLKSVSTNLVDNKDTLPEIARASEIEEVCTPGSKEPALFQRRPNLVQSISPGRNVPKSPNKSLPQSSTKRNYTRVLVSPEPRPSRWNSPDSNSEKPLFSRRSPRRSPKRVSPAYHKKEKKKSKQGSSKKAKDLNITLNVPEESLDSLNTTDILTRIMKCNDNDVDIETLREAKRQILSELNQTGAKYDDISDLLLKSYKDSKNSKTFSSKKVEEVEEGELSDSESEAIDSIYGDFLNDGKGKQSSSSKASKAKSSVDNEQPRKIQICLVINHDKDGKPTETSKADELNTNLNETDTSDFQMYNQKDVKDKISEEKAKLPSKENSIDVSENKIKDSGVKDSDKKQPDHGNKENSTKPANFYKPIVEDSPSDSKVEKDTTSTNDLNKTGVTTEKVTGLEKPDNVPSTPSANLVISNDSKETKKEETVEIPLLNEPSIPPKADKTKGDIVSEIDILQALKNEILSETLSLPGSDTVTPPLHQPKLTKVASAQEIQPKKRISFEKYKEKAVPQTQTTTPLFIKDSSQCSKEDQAKKQSLKLTMKECERFNFPTKLALDEDDVSDDEEIDKNISMDNIYDNIAPKSPDHNDSHVGNTLPIIIPVDSIKTTAVAPTGDIDMRTMIPPMMKNVSPSVAPFSSPVLNKDVMADRLSNENRPINSDRTNIPSDPRLRRDLCHSTNADSPHFPHKSAIMEGPPFLPQPSNMENPFPQLINPEMPPRPVPPPTNFYPNMTPNRAPNMTPSINPSMTPSRTPVLTPNARTYDMSSMQSFDPDENAGQKHVYAPLFTSFEREKESSVAREIRPNYKPEMDDSRQTRWDTNKDVNPPRKWDERDSRSTSMQRDGPDYQKSRYNDSYNNYNKFQKNTKYNIDRRDSYSRSECPRTPVHPFGRSDCPTTPSHPFGRHEAPMTPLPSFGRGDCPSTPSYQFGRSDCPQTPSHPFGRSDAPATPSHPFGRSECPTTPSHPFGRVDMPMTPSHPFGRSENTTRDPRLNRSNDVDSFQKNDRDRNSYYKDRNSSNYNSYKDTQKNYGGPDAHRPYREQSVGRNDRFNKFSPQDPDSRHYSKEQQRPRREPSIGRGMSRDTVEEERFYSRDRSYGHKGKDNHNESDNSRSNSDFGVRKGFYRERSVGRSGPDERQYRDPRATSVGRSFAKEDDNRLSVKPHAGRSFTIDTSVTTTFQDFLDTGRKMQVFDYTFDSRRKRASSVGRSLCRESSVGRTLPQKPKQLHEPFEYMKRNDFKRAASVGRDLASHKAEKSFKDIKAEFQLFKSRIDAKQPKVAKSATFAKKDNKFTNMPHNRQSRKDFYENKNFQESTSKKPYSPRKNYRDPRMRANTKFDDRNRRNSGIVYSNDNITKGTILGSGYGVKNYKIPKIKRPVEEPEEKTKKVETDKTETAKKATDKADIQKKVVPAKGETHKKGVIGKTDNVTDKKIQKQEPQKKTSIEKSLPEKGKPTRSDDIITKAKKQNEDISDIKAKKNKSETDKTDEVPDSNSDSIETLEKRVTRSSRKSTSSPLNTRSRIKKAVIYDTDSDEEQLNEKKKNTEGKPAANKAKAIAESKVTEKTDLDNDLEPNKMTTPTDFSSDITLETMLESITSQGKEDTKSLNEEESLNIISEVIKNDLNQSAKNLGKQEPSKVNEDQKSTNTVTKEVKVIKAQDVDAKMEQISELKIKHADDLISNITASVQEPLTDNLANRDDMVTTSDNDNVQQPDKADKSEEQMDVDGSSTPDSTINTIELTQNKPSLQESIPDSTNEVQNEPNSIVSSTHDNAEPCNSNKESTPAIDSIGNILSILQNKSKIKELLSMLGEQSADNDKIKKKLEKLSEIVSDEEDDSKDSNIETTKKDVTHDDTLPASAEEKDLKPPNKNDLKNEDPSDNLKDSINQKDDLKESNKVEQNETISLEKPTEKTPDDLAKEDTIFKGIEQKDTPSVEKLTVKTSKNLASKIQKKSEDVEPDNADNNAALEDENEDEEEEEIDPAPTAKKAPVKKGRKRNGKWKAAKNVAVKPKRVTRSSKLQTGSSKKRKNELLKLQEDIKEMFMRDEVLNATGIRMCRLAKLVDDKKEESSTIEPTPVVVVEKVKDIGAYEETQSDKSGKIKIKPKNKQPPAPAEIEKKPNKVKPSKYKPGPKSKTKHLQSQDDDDNDPYEFESDSVSDMMNDEASTKSNDGKDESSSDSEDESLASSRSVGSTELLSELKKKPKRKRSSWQSGVIKPRNRKKKPDAKPNDAKPTDTKQSKISLNDDTLIAKKPVRASSVTIPDPNCFTDKLYCFRQGVFEYPCRLCTYSGPDIVHHYKQQHPHSEIPLSRMNPETARDAIEQCDEINFQVVSKIPTDKYVCRFCFKEFGKKKGGGILESFFWHVVSMHTGEYKKLCSECINITRCPFNLDIPPPPKDAKGQLIGYICEKCNFTQISLENLKTHVIVRHNDEQTEVYTINLAVMSKNMITSLYKKYGAASTSEPEHRVLRSSRSNQSMEASDDRSDVTDSDHTDEPIATRIKRKKKLPSVPNDTPAKSSYHSKITFENDDHLSDVASNGGDSVSTIKVEQEELEDHLHPEPTQNHPEDISETYAADALAHDTPQNTSSDDIFAYPHFKISYTDAGLKEYVCCINGVESHYKTTLLISMKKHVQTKHSELWDGYCFVCKVIVTPQGQHNFKECLQHYLDTHMDNFPVLEKPVQEETPAAPVEVVTPPKPKIHVRPLSELISTEEPTREEELPTLPKIESIVSLSAQPEELPEPEEPIYEPPPVTEPEIPFKYEEVQAEVMSKKQQVVLATMINKEKLMNVYKCAGRYCSFTTDFIEDALQHASTHQRIGGENAMSCAYCNFDCMGNTIDLVMHVFKSHGSCPYVCGYCFYRAAASQLVTAHSSRTHHRLKPIVLRSTVAPPPAPKDTSMLTREQSVQYYVCGHASCKFRTYTAKKFYEHLLHTHPAEHTRPCYLCTTTPQPASPTELLQHMKTHDVNVYQCTWCVHGADNEAALLAHTASKHPTKQPQAYLRVITKKDGSEEYRVLPLVSFNKSKVPVEEVPPSGNKDNPVREAERSIELEKLIGHTNQMIESMATMTPVEPSVPQPSPAPVETPNTQAVITKITPAIPETPPVESIETQPRPKTPSPSTLEEERSRMKTPILKTEPEDNPTPSKDSSSDVIYCLDSDDEDSIHNVIDLSEEVATAAKDSESRPITEATKKSHFIKIPPSELFKCPNCFMTFKNVPGFKRHTNLCFVTFDGPLVCAHCSKEVVDREQLIVHYTSDHDPTASENTSVCGLCAQRFPTIGNAKRHMKVSHKTSKMLVTSTKLEDQTFVYTVKPMIAPSEKRGPKRKLSSSNVSEPPAKKRFGPQDVDQLPINPILDELVYCSECEFNTKVRLNMVRHLQLHAQQQPAPNTAPVNPVPHLETNEMHFDRMVNLASSSIVTRAPDKTTTHTTTVTSQISAEEASRYPKLVAERQRYSCGAKDCSYISLDEAMFNRHWNTLHNTLNQFNCVHCARNLFDSRPLTFERVIDHLKMHDSTLYGCSSCLFCHYKKDHVEKHLSTVHKAARLIVVREEVETVPSGPAATPAASRMDLKLWQCGLCPFRSLLRPAIIEHCGKMHQSKMQYKCGHCPFRASSLENVQKHQTNSHPDKAEEIFYYFYQDGTVPEEPDGVPKWQKQRQKVGFTEPESEVKTELADSTLAQLIASPQKPMTPTSASSPLPSVDLNIVKQELTESFPDDDEPLDSLCRKYGQFCEPNGLSYKCPLCSVVEDTLELMQSHLFEELKYRRWACAMCPYRAYHGAGLAGHMAAEHVGRRLPPRALPRDMPIEKWVAALLQHQTAAIATNKENLAKQKIITERPAKPSKPDAAPAEDPKPKPTMTELIKAFGPFGQPSNMMYCCPKCPFKVKEEAAMRDHLEGELTKIRWHCSHCTVTFQNYHEAQFHCKSVHLRQSARAREAARDPALRAAWLAAALQVQKLSMKSLPITQPAEPEPAAAAPAAEADNSLLVVRYEENVSTEEPQPRNPPAAAPPRKRPLSTDSDDDRLVIDEPSPTAATATAPVAKKRTGGSGPGGKCPYCDLQTKYNHVLRDHICNSHYGVKPYTCTLCNYQNHRNKVKAHAVAAHPGHEPSALVRPTPLPARPQRPPEQSVPKSEVCLTCEAVLSQAAVEVHRRENADHAFAAKGDVIVKCSLCLALHNDVASLREHHTLAHANSAMDYAHFRILNDERDIRQCGYCSKRSINAKDMNSHLDTAHPNLPPKFKDVPQLTFVSPSSQDDAAGMLM